MGAHAGAQGDSNIQPGTTPVHRALNTLPCHLSGPESRLLAWREIQPDCIPRQAHTSLIPRMGAK